MWVQGVPENESHLSANLQGTLRRSSVGSMFGGHCFSTEGGFDAETGKGKGCVILVLLRRGAEVEVDTETGKVRVLRIVSAVDVGKAIHPKQCGLQNEGSLLSGLGSALFEEMVYDNGQPINSNFLDYMLAVHGRSSGEFQSLLVETPHPEGPCGAKGMGEAALPPMAPAIGNAIANALGGVRIRDLPVQAGQDRRRAKRGPRRTAKLKITISTTINGQREEVAVNPHQTLAGIPARRSEAQRRRRRLQRRRLRFLHGADRRPAGQFLSDPRQQHRRQRQSPPSKVCRKTANSTRCSKRFLKHQAFQCGFCTTGMIMAVKGLLNENPHPSEEEARDYLSGNLCRCGTYKEVLAAVKELANR